MHLERWQLLKEVFQTALLQDREERSTYLNRVCAADSSLKQEIEEMLAADERAESFIEKPLFEAASGLLASDEALSIGREIGPYRILSKLGAGGMGQVYLAQHTQLGRYAALKVLAPALVGDSNSRARFLREARLASVLEHANICTIYEIGSADGQDFISMQYVEGDTLKDVVAGEPLSMPRLLSIALQVLDALQAAHAHAIVHRDINSNNIMVTAEGQVKVLDFGVANVQQLHEHDVAHDSTPSRASFGTPAFMSPEQARGLRADHRSDIFSVGVLLYEMTTGQLPFTGGSAAETLNAVINEPHRPPGEMNARLTPGLAAVIDRALSKDPARRYQSAREMYIELQQLGDAGKKAVEHERKPRAHKWSSVEGLVRRNIGVVAVAVVVLTAAGAGATRFLERGPEIDSVAVLPFTTERAGPDTEYLGDGLTESLISTLARLPRLRVMARSTMFTYQGRNLDPRVVGRELRVRAVLTGHVVQHGDHLVIGIEMVDVANGSRLWGQTYTRTLTELSALPTDLANDVSRQMRLHVGDKERQHLAVRAASGEAYQLYMKGRYFFNRRTAEGFNKGIEYFQQAIEKDAGYALAYAGLADCYTQLGSYQILPPRESYPLARAAAEKALSLDESLAEAHTSLALVQTHAGEWPRAEREFLRAIELNPNYESAQRWYGIHLAGVGRMDEAIAATRRALDIDPLSIPTNTQLGRMLYLARQYDQAIDQLRKTLEMDPNFVRAHLLIGWVFVAKHMYAEAVVEYEKAIALGGRSTYIAEIGRAYALSGRRREAEEILDKLKTLSTHTFVPAYDMAQVYEALGAQEQAISWLKKAFDDGPSQFMLKVDPKWDRLRTHPGFQQLLQGPPY